MEYTLFDKIQFVLRCLTRLSFYVHFIIPFILLACAVASVHAFKRSISSLFAVTGFSLIIIHHVVMINNIHQIVNFKYVNLFHPLQIIGVACLLIAIISIPSSNKK